MLNLIMYRKGILLMHAARVESCGCRPITESSKNGNLTVQSIQKMEHIPVIHNILSHTLVAESTSCHERSRSLQCPGDDTKVLF